MLCKSVALRKTSLVDYPGLVSSVLFFPGCNLCCPWCHNRQLLGGGAPGLVSMEDAFAHIRKRAPVLQGVVLSGGEPCLFENISDIIAEIKKIALNVKLDTNGMFPAVLQELLSREETRPDYIALDLKLAPARYTELIAQTLAFSAAKSPAFNPGQALIQSAALIRNSGIAHEFRSLALPALHGTGGFFSEEDIRALAPLTGNAPWHFRPFKGGNCLDPAWDSREESTEASHARIKYLAEKAEQARKNT